MAMSFPGTASAAGILTTPKNTKLQPATAVSVEAWLRFTAVPAAYTMAVSYGSDLSYAPYGLFFRAAGALTAQFYTTAGVLEVQSPLKLVANTTYHVVSTFDGTTGRLYVNGNQVASVAKTGTLSGYVPNYGVGIGDDAQVSDPAFKGTIDEVAIYAGTVLTAAQVQNHYNAGTGGIVTTPTPSPTPTSGPTPTPTPSTSNQYALTVLNDKPTAFYELDDSGTIAADASGHSYSGTIGSSVTKGVASLVPTSTGTAMAFPGMSSASGIVSFPQNVALQPATAVTLEAWIRFSTAPAAYTVIAGYGSDYSYAPYELFFRAGSQLVAQFYLSSGVVEVASPTRLAVNTTYHLVSTYDGAAARLYVNGVQAASVAASGSLVNYVKGYGLAIGDDATLSDPPFKGTIDEVALYAGKALTATQVSSHYSSGETGGGPPPTATPSPGPSTDWLTMGYDVQRTGYNPNEKTLGAGNVAGIKAYWSRPYSLSGGEIGEPVYASNVDVGGQATNVLYAASGSGLVAAINADTGIAIWTKQLGTSGYSCGTGTFTFGANGAPVIDRQTNRIYVGDGALKVHALDLATGAEATGWPISIQGTSGHDFLYAGLTYNPANKLLYAETASTCDISPWHGLIASIDTSSAVITGTFYPSQGASGGSIWGFGGASVDPGTNDVYIATGNTDSSVSGVRQSDYYGEQILALNSNVSSVLAHSYATLPPGPDSDYGATPLLFQPSGCQPLLAAVNKSGLFVLYDRSNIGNGPLQTIAMSIVTDNGNFIGVPAYDPTTQYVYVGLPATNGIYKPGVAAFAMQSNCTLNPTPVWNASFGEDGAANPSDDTPRSPIAIANGVLYISDYGSNATYAFNDLNGTQLWTSALSGHGIVGPIVVNGKLYVGDESGKITAWTP